LRGGGSETCWRSGIQLMRRFRARLVAVMGRGGGVFCFWGLSRGAVQVIVYCRRHHVLLFSSLMLLNGK